MGNRRLAAVRGRGHRARQRLPRRQASHHRRRVHLRGPRQTDGGDANGGVLARANPRALREDIREAVGAGKSATGATPQAKRTSLRCQRPRRFTPGHIDPSQRRDRLHRRDEARRDATNGPGAHEGADARAPVPRARQRRRTLLPRRLRQRFFVVVSIDVISRQPRG